jgi:hypothetical protein
VGDGFIFCHHSKDVRGFNVLREARVPDLPLFSDPQESAVPVTVSWLCHVGDDDVGNEDLIPAHRSKHSDTAQKALIAGDLQRC